MFGSDVSIHKKGTVEALSDIFRTGFESLNGRLKNNSYVFTKFVLAEMAHNGVPDDLYDQSIKRWTQLSVFMNVFRGRAPTSFRFVRLVAKFIRENAKKQSKPIDQPRDPLDSPFQFAQDRSSLSESSGDEKYREYVMNKHHEHIELDYSPIE